MNVYECICIFMCHQLGSPAENKIEMMVPNGPGFDLKATFRRAFNDSVPSRLVFVNINYLTM